MKKLLLGILSAALCILFSIGIFAIEKGDYGYYDLDHNGKVEFSEATSLLRDVLNNAESDVSLLRVLHSLKALASSETLAATITSIDTNALTATISTEYFENVTVPLSVFGLDENAKPADFSGVCATIAILSPASAFAEKYDGTTNGIYAAEANLKFTDVPANDDRSILSMDELNTAVVNGSHANDNLSGTSLALSYRDTAVLSSTTQAEYEKATRYDKSYYPRVKKVNDNLYLLLFMYSQMGQHLYYATSSDGTNWNEPQVLWDSAKHIINAENSERYFAMNADACVLDDGSVLCVFAVRDEKNYRANPDGCGLAMVRGTVDESNNITWSAPKGIYTGQVWEPSVLKRDDGQIHVYFTQVAPDIVEFGYDESHRSSETGLIVSNNNGETWTPDIKPGDTNYYRATTVYREYVGDKDGRPHYNGQMPVAVQLANGRIFMAVEIKDLNGRFRISTALSSNGGEWKPLAKGEEGTYTKFTSTPNSSPYVDRFPSGEIYLTHNYGGKLVARLGTADASSFAPTFECAPGCAGIWGSCSLVGSHKMVTAMQNKDVYTDEEGNSTEKEKNEIHLFYYYLNHRISAKKIAVNVDKYRNEWALNTDALFVGSASQAQAALQIAHDKDNIYFLINRLDYYLSKSGEISSVYIAASDNAYYRIDIADRTEAYTVYFVDANGNETEKASGTTVKILTDGNFFDTNLDKGFLIELSVPKSALGIGNASSIKAGIGITNVDKSVTTTDVMVDLASTANWPTVVLEN